MAGLLEENRIRLQQRISQRLRGGTHTLNTRTEWPHRFIAQRRRPDAGQSDPFRLQAQEYIFNNRGLAEKYDISQILRQVRKEQGDMMQLPMLRPRFTELHPNKGVPTQKYIDIILERKGPMHRAPTRRVKVGMFTGKEYDDSMSIKSYRNIDPIEFQSYQHTSIEEEESSFGKIASVAPNRIQYKTQQNQASHYESGRVYSPQRPRKENGITALKGKKMSTANSNLEELSMTVPTTRASRNLPFLHKLRKRLGSRDKKFVDTISSQTFLTENAEKNSLVVMPKKNEDPQLNRTVPLPPIRITVTNPLPDSDANQNVSKVLNSVPEQNIESPHSWLEEGQKKMPLVRFSLPKKRKNKKIKKRKRPALVPKTESDNADIAQHTDVNGDALDQQIVDNDDTTDSYTERRLSHNDSLMPAPITKITFQSCNEANLRKPKKVVTNVHIERVVQKNVIATHPEFFHRKEPAVKVSTFEMADDPNPELIFRKDGTLGPAPPSTNYVNFQKATRQGGQSRQLLSLRNRVLAAEAGNVLHDWSPSGLLGIHGRDHGLLDSISNPTKLNDGVATHRKLGRIRAMKRSLMDAHKALFEETGGKIEVDGGGDDVRSEKSFTSDLSTSVTSIRKSYYINRLPDAYPQNPVKTMVFQHPARIEEAPKPEKNAAPTRSIGTQWTTDKIPVPLNTPQPPPNTAFLRKTDTDNNQHALK